VLPEVQKRARRAAYMKKWRRQRIGKVICPVRMRLVSVPFPRRFVTSAQLLDDYAALFGDRA